MADFGTRVNPLFLREEYLRQGIELLFYANRDLMAETDALLEQRGLGRADHRALYFVARHPDITVGELLSILRVTKQSLGRVLGRLQADGLVTQRPGTRDRRQRLLRLTPVGEALEAEIGQRQRAFLARAYRAAGAEAVEGFRTVLVGMIRESDRARVATAVPAPDPLPRVRRG
ncbi:MAG: MarR family winged helix-turn-helix transcriptional regulator [Alphaproteobacteria bacterium]